VLDGARFYPTLFEEAAPNPTSYAVLAIWILGLTRFDGRVVA